MKLSTDEIYFTVKYGDYDEEKEITLGEWMRAVEKKVGKLDL